jgi:hypothetical protein
MAVVDYHPEFSVKILHTILHRQTSRRGQRSRERGQSMIEMALTFPILLLILAGSLEVAMYYNNYLTLVDSTREAARFSADNDYLNADEIEGCLPGPPDPYSSSRDFYNQASCLVLQNMFGITFDKATDDIIVSVFTVKDGVITARNPPDPASVATSAHHTTLDNNPQSGWSYCLNVIKADCTPAASFFDNSAVQARLGAVASAPDTGLVLIEVYHLHHQFLGLIPPGLAFMPQTVMMHAYTIMPLPSAGPPAE